MADLSVGIGADIKGLNAGLSAANKEISNFSNNAQKNLSKFDNSVKSGGQSLKSFEKSSNTAGFALQNLGRVAQDTPFGFIGIQNNLNPLLESFQRLRQESGSNIGAFKALGQSLTGAGGVGLALSLVGAAILIYQNGIAGFNKKTKEAKEETDKFKESLNSLATAASNEIGALSLLFDASQNLNIPLSNRKKIVDKLQEQYPSYFKNLSDEEILAGKAGNAYKQLTQDLINSGIARAGESLISAKVKELADFQLQTALATKNFKPGTIQTFVIDETRPDIGASSNDYIKAVTSEVNDVRKVVQDLVEGFNLSAIFGDFKGSKEEKEKFARKLIEGIDVEAIEKETIRRGVAITEKVKPIIENLTNIYRKNNPLPLILPLELKPILIGGNIPTELSILGQQVLEQAAILKDNIAPALSSAFKSIGEGLSTGDFSNLGQSLLQALSGFLAQLGQLLIKEGTVNVLAGIASNIIVPGSGANRILGGIGLIAAGGLVSVGSGAISGGNGQSQSSRANGTRIPGFATGVTNFKGGLAMVGERGPELLNLPTGSNVITNQNTNKLINSRGSSGSTTFIPDVRISGQDLVVVFNKAIQTSKRRG